MRATRGWAFLVLLVACTVLLTGCFGAKSGGKSAATIVEGMLNNEFGHPVGGTTLAVGSVAGKTGNDGRFRLTGVPSGAQTLTLTRNGYLTREMSLQVVSGRVNQVSDPGKPGEAILRTIHSLSTQNQQAKGLGDGAATHTTCETCHLRTAAGADNPKFLKANAQSLCDAPGCHVAPDGGAWEHPGAHLDNTRIQPTGDLAVYDQISCLRCHLSHSPQGGSLTPGFTPTSYTNYCIACHNPAQPGNQYDPAAHNPGSNCTAACHKTNGQAKSHKLCSRTDAGCHALSSSLPLHAAHRNNPDGCAACHDTENGPTDNKLLKGGDELCLTGCHAAKHAGIRDAYIAAPSDEYRHNVPCSSCHDVHRMGNAPYDLVVDPLTKQAIAYPREGDWVPSNDTDFCLSCHGKYLNDPNATTRAWAADWQVRGAKDAYWEFVTPSWQLTHNTRFFVPYVISGTEKYLLGHNAHNTDEQYSNNPIPCEACHGPHASKQPNLVDNPLRDDWPPYFVVGPVDDNGYPMNNMCHNTCHSKW